MEQVIRYLSSPLRIGVWRLQLEIDFISLRKLFEYISEPLDKVQSRFLMGIMDQVEKENTVEAYLLALTICISLLKKRINCPEKVRDYFLHRYEIIKDTYFEERWGNIIEIPRNITEIEVLTYREDEDKIATLFDSCKIVASSRFEDLAFWDVRDYSFHGIFKSRIIKDTNDVLIITVIETDKKLSPIFNLISTKKKSIEIYKQFLEHIPFIGKTAKTTSFAKTHSSRYVFEPYPFAVQLWLENNPMLYIPTDLKDLIKSAMDYYSKQEWRTSIIISAITSEFVIADIYEETKKDYAPNIPLGSLYHEIKKVFPEDIQKSIEILNKVRILAVHRSKYRISSREATMALMGTTSLVMWYITNFARAFRL